MMLRLIFAVLLITGPLPALAQQAWGDAGGCARVAGNDAGIDMVFILWPDRIERHESTCTITKVEGDVNTRSVIHTTCSGEGETWTASYGMTPVGEGVFSIWPVDAPDSITQLRRCP